MVNIPERPDTYREPAFLEWVNTVTRHRHGGIRLLDRIIVYEQAWTTEELAKVKRMNKVFFDPRRPEEPVVVLRGLKMDYLLDGNRRINTWIRDESPEKHLVWLVCPVYRKE